MTEPIDLNENIKSGFDAVLTHAPKWVNVRTFGAVGDDQADDTQPIQDAINFARDHGRSVYFPRGYYKITAPLTIYTGTTFEGEGINASHLLYKATGTQPLITAVGVMKVRLRGLDVWAVGGQSLVDMSGCFGWVVSECMFRGGYPTTVNTAQYGIQLRDNSGDSVFTACVFSNLYTGIRTLAIQNVVVGCLFSVTHTGVHGTSPAGQDSYNAGLTLVGCHWVGDTKPGSRHIWFDGPGNLLNVLGGWMEKADIGIEVGSADGTKGPLGVYLSGVKIAAYRVALRLRKCGSPPTLSGVQFDAHGANDAEFMASLAAAGQTLQPGDDLSKPRIEITQGEGNSLGCYASYDYGRPWPEYWVVLGRGGMSTPQFLRPVVVQKQDGDGSDLVKAVDPANGYRDVFRITNEGEYISGKAGGGIVLTAPNGTTKRRISIDNTGNVSIVPA